MPDTRSSRKRRYNDGDNGGYNESNLYPSDTMSLATSIADLQRLHQQSQPQPPSTLLSPIDFHYQQQQQAYQQQQQQHYHQQQQQQRHHQQQQQQEQYYLQQASTSHIPTSSQAQIAALETPYTAASASSSATATPYASFPPSTNTLSHLIPSSNPQPPHIPSINYHHQPQSPPQHRGGEVILVHSQSPPPSSGSTFYDYFANPTPRFGQMPGVSQDRMSYTLPSIYGGPVHPAPYSSSYIPPYSQLSVPSAYHSITGIPYTGPSASSNGKSGNPTAFYKTSSPTESSRSFATTAADDASRQSSISHRLPPSAPANSNAYVSQPQAPSLGLPRTSTRGVAPPQLAPLPAMTDYIDLTTSPGGSVGPSAPKRRKKDIFYDPPAGDSGTNANAAYPTAAQSLIPPPPRSSPRLPEDHGRYCRDQHQPAAPQQTLPSCADKEGHFIVTLLSDLTPRYKIMRLLGQGTFGKVVEAYDRHTRRKVAIKVIRAVQKYRDASKVEIRVLNTLKANDPQNRKQCIHLEETFDYRNHICMVFELLSQSVFDFLKENAFTPFPPYQIQQLGAQIIEAVAFLHDLGLVHTDLKPENLMLEDNTTRTILGPRRTSKSRKELVKTSIRLIDFGSAIFEEDYHSSVVSTRHYRAPEIILCTGWSFPCDMWSVGCILVEFCTGDALFQTHDNLEHLAMMEAVLGKFPERMMRSVGKSAAKYFRNNRLDWPAADTQRQSKKFVKNMKPLRDIIRPKNEIMEAFLDLVQRMLIYDPKERITARQALGHRFFQMDIPPSGV